MATPLYGKNETGIYKSFVYLDEKLLNLVKAITWFNILPEDFVQSLLYWHICPHSLIN